MSSPALEDAGTVIAPPGRSTADPTHQYGLLFRVANAVTSGQATNTDIPESYQGCYARFLTRGIDANTPVDVQFCFLCINSAGVLDTAPTLVYNQTSATGTGAAAAAQTLLDRQPEHILIPRNARRIVFISSAASGWFEASRSGVKRSNTR